MRTHQAEHLRCLLITLGNSSDEGRENRAAQEPPGDILCLTEGFSRPGSNLPLRHRAGALEGGGDVNTELLCGMTKKHITISWLRTLYSKLGINM